MAGQKATQNTQWQNDQWTLDDTLGLGRVGDQVARMILEVKPPFTLGVTGKWGSGKTSILKRSYTTLGGEPLQQALAFSSAGVEETNESLKWRKRKSELNLLNWKNEHYQIALQTRCVWFSPWQHQNEDNPLIPLLLEIRQQFSSWECFKGEVKDKTRRAALAGMTLLEKVADAAMTLSLGKNIKVASGTTEAVRKAWQDGNPNLIEASDGQRFHILFEDAVKAVLSAEADDAVVPDQARLVIFIDDLDRCEESVIVRLLEVIKLYLNSSRCVFVLGLDDAAVIDSLGRYWKRSEDLNREYLEKLFQTRVPVPLPNPAKITDGIIDQLQAHDIKHATIMAKDIEQLLEPNPRKVKNFVNSLCAAWAVLDAKNWANTDEDEEEARRFVMFHYIQQYHRSVWRLLERQPVVLPFLYAVLRDAAVVDREVNVVHGLNAHEQRLLMEMFRRAFSHVLKNKADSDKEAEKHSFEDLDAAVENFIHRQDRKRSDDYLCYLFKVLIGADKELDKRYLYAEQPTTKPETNMQKD